MSVADPSDESADMNHAHGTKIAYAWHTWFGWHGTGSYVGWLPSDPVAGLAPYQHFENPDTKRRLYELVEATGLIDELLRVAPRQAGREELERVHTSTYVDRIAIAISEQGGDAGDGNSPFGRNAFAIAASAAVAVIECTDAVQDGRTRNSYAHGWPPGHHALPDTGMGFCLFANIAIAAEHTLRIRKVERIAVVGWDVHHGNGIKASSTTIPRSLPSRAPRPRLPPQLGLGVRPRRRPRPRKLYQHSATSWNGQRGPSGGYRPSRRVGRGTIPTRIRLLRRGSTLDDRC